MRQRNPSRSHPLFPNRNRPCGAQTSGGHRREPHLLDCGILRSALCLGLQRRMPSDFEHDGEALFIGWHTPAHYRGQVPQRANPASRNGRRCHPYQSLQLYLLQPQRKLFLCCGARAPALLASHAAIRAARGHQPAARAFERCRFCRALRHASFPTPASTGTRPSRPEPQDRARGPARTSPRRSRRTQRARGCPPESARYRTSGCRQR